MIKSGRRIELPGYLRRAASVLAGLLGLIGADVNAMSLASVEQQRAALEARVQLVRQALKSASQDGTVRTADGKSAEQVAQWFNWPNWNNWGNWNNWRNWGNWFNG